MPVAVVCYFTRGYLARFIFSQNNPQIAELFGFLTAAIFFTTLYSIMSRWFYAHKDTKTPLFVSFFTVGLDIVLVNILARPGAYGASGLALTQSIVATVEVIILTIIIVFRDTKLFNKEFWGGILKIVAVTGFSVLAGFIMISLFPLGANDRGIITLGSKLLIIVAVVAVVHVGMSAFFEIEEVKPVFNRLKKIITKPVRINY
jgi:peptidoglycan biosynthesis protein MviN/MurJ (putative lipid II flippase)